MMSKVLALAGLIALIHASPIATEEGQDPCCQGKCTTAGEEKYWSIAKGILGESHCGECCMDPSKYNLYHFFEKNLTKSDTDFPCKSFGFTKYDSTVTHGFGPVKMTLDLYDLPKEVEAMPEATNVTLHKVGWPASGQCAEMSMPASAAGFREKFGGFKLGACSDDGYTVSGGVKHECSPKVAGKQWCADVAIFAQVVEEQGKEPCCQGKCTEPGKQKFWSIAKGILGESHCGECCMDPSKYNLYHFFEKNLTKSDTDFPCKSFGFTKYDSTVTHGFGPVKMTLDLYDLPKEVEAMPEATNVTLHKVGWPASGQCAEMSMPASAAGFREKFGGFKLGACSDDGYTVSGGVKHECSPKVAGKQWCADVAIFAQVVEEQGKEPCCQGKCTEPGKQKFWSIAKGILGESHCGECCMDPSKYNLYHFFEKNLTKSDTDFPCTSFGFTKYDSTVTHGLGPVGMTLDLYDLPSNVQEIASEH